MSLVPVIVNSSGTSLGLISSLIRVPTGLMAQFSRRSFHVLATTTVLAADRARGWVRSRFILPSGARRTAGRIFGLAGVAWSGVEQLPDSSHFMSVRRAYFWQTRRRRGGRDRHEEPAVVRETRRIPAGASTFAPSSSGWYMDVLCTTTPLGVLNSRGDLGIPSRLHSARLVNSLP